MSTAGDNGRPAGSATDSGRRARGTVLWFSGEKGYGVIEDASGGHVSVHYTEIEGEGFRSLDEGEDVEFEVARDGRGRRRAGAVRRVGKG